MPKYPLTVEGIRQALVASASPEARREYIETLRAEVAEFERRYEIRTREMREAIAASLRPEDLAAVEWAQAAQALERAETSASENAPDA